MDYLLYPLIALLALLLAVVMFFRNRKNDDDDQDEVSLQTLTTSKEPELPEENPAETFTETEKQYVHEVAAELDESDLKDLEELELGDGEGVDPKGEADIYLSLGNYRQAENILRKAIEADPQDSSLRLKLLEVHVNANNPDAFEAEKASLAELNDSQADARALALEAELLPGKYTSPDTSADSDAHADISTGIPDSSVDSADFEAPTLDYDLGDVSPNASLEDDTYPQDEEGVTPSADRDLNDIDLFTTSEFSAEESSADKVSADEGLTSTSPDTQSSAGESEPDFDLDLDLEDMDLGALSTEIDEGMQDIDFDEEDPAKAQNKQAGADKTEDTALSDDQDFSMAESESSTIEQAEPRTENDGFDDLASVEDSLGDDDESDTKLVLAEAYADMGDPDNARDLLEEVLQSGTEEQRKKANDLLETLS
jgi:pilus assembly protein FimV